MFTLKYVVYVVYVYFEITDTSERNFRKNSTALKFSRKTISRSISTPISNLEFVEYFEEFLTVVSYIKKSKSNSTADTRYFCAFFKANT